MTSMNIETALLLYGKYIPFLAVIYSIVYLFTKYRTDKQHQLTPIVYFILYVGINNVLNNVLKALIRDPRPESSLLTYTPITNADVYGMPSGHVQNMAFITTFFYQLFPKDIPFHILNVMNIFITGIQRYKQNNHTFLQLVGGLFVGIVFGMVSVRSVGMPS